MTRISSWLSFVIEACILSTNASGVNQILLIKFLLPDEIGMRSVEMAEIKVVENTLALADIGSMRVVLSKSDKPMIERYNYNNTQNRKINVMNKWKQTSSNMSSIAQCAIPGSPTTDR
ncbi:hypothetical protein V1522DRAFT_406116 [Lipomyces starkeyi]